MNIIDDLRTTGAVSDLDITTCLMESGYIRIVFDGIIPRIEGTPSPEEVLVSLHVGGKIDVITLIGETIVNVRSAIESKTLANAAKVEKINEGISYLKVVRGIIEKLPDESTGSIELDSVDTGDTVSIRVI